MGIQLLFVWTMWLAVWCSYHSVRCLGQDPRYKSFKVGGESSLDPHYSWINVGKNPHLLNNRSSTDVYQNWANSLHNFYVNDTIEFVYDPDVNSVYLVNETDFEACTKADYHFKDTSGNTMLRLSSPGIAYVMSGDSRSSSSEHSGDCLDQMKFSIFVGTDSTSVHTAQFRSPPTTVVPWTAQSSPLFYDSYVNTSFMVGDALKFEFDEEVYDVRRVSARNYHNCNTNETAVISSIKDTGQTFVFPEAGHYYFICGREDYCLHHHMKFTVTAYSSAPAPPSPSHVQPTAGPSPAFAGSKGKLTPAALTAIGVGAVVSALFLFKFIATCSRCKSAESSVFLRRAGNVQSQIGNVCTIFELRDLEKATKNFSEEAKLGRGGFATVYKGILDDNTVVAIKRPHQFQNIEGEEPVEFPSDEEFINEVSILARLNHRNLVRLVGCCVKSRVPLLVYEYATNGTLEDHLNRAKAGESTELDWHRRLRIAVQTADALRYLHDQANPPIFHRDVKPANILLDQDFNVKVADFGHSKAVNLEATHVVTKNLVYTLGYIDPDYLYTGQVSSKTDVYSFGMVLLVLITAKTPYEASKDIAQIRDKKVCGIIDPTIRDQCVDEIEVIQGVAEVAVDCLRPKEERPSMFGVLERIGTIVRSTSTSQDLDSDYTGDGKDHPLIFPGFEEIFARLLEGQSQTSSVNTST